MGISTWVVALRIKTSRLVALVLKTLARLMFVWSFTAPNAFLSLLGIVVSLLGQTSSLLGVWMENKMRFSEKIFDFSEEKVVDDVFYGVAGHPNTFLSFHFFFGFKK
jgi:hypothetical protein